MCFIKAGAISLYCRNYLADKLLLRIVFRVFLCLFFILFPFPNRFDYKCNYQNDSGIKKYY